MLTVEGWGDIYFLSPSRQKTFVTATAGAGAIFDPGEKKRFVFFFPCTLFFFFFSELAKAGGAN